MNKNIEKKLLIYQIDHTLNIIHIINHNNTVLDASDTGTGKTYTAIAACAQMKYKPIIICPKSVITNWLNVCKIFNVNPLFIVNYETLKIGKFYDSNKNRIKCPYINIIRKKINNTYEYEYQWNLKEKNILFIFDEVHKCSNINTDNGNLLYSTKKLNLPMLLLSATVADSVEKFLLFFYILNFINPKEVIDKNISFNDYMKLMIHWISQQNNPMVKIHAMLYPQRATRMKIDIIGDLFPKTQIIAQPYDMGKKREIEIEKEYKNIAFAINELDKKNKANILVMILRAQQKIELLKTPIFVELTNDFLENHKSVVIFVNFTKTLKILSEMLHTKCIINGGQDLNHRDTNISNFQNNKERIIICNIKAGGVGVSLHDITGTYPRVSIISPTWNSIDLVQALGRIHRANGKSVSLQRIIYCANTIEEKIADKLQLKLKNLHAINDGDLNLSGIIDFNKNHKKL